MKKKETMCSRWWIHCTCNESKRITNRHKKIKNGNTLLEPPSTRPSKQRSTSIDLKRSTSLSISSKIRVLRSHQINYIRQAGTIFQTFEELFPKTFLHAKRRETIVSGITHWTLNIRKTSLYKTWANLQWSRRWSTVSPLQWHKQH